MAYEVTLRCKVRKLVTCKDCTEDQAREHPFDYAVDELEIDQEEWEVVEVRKVVD